MFRQEKEIEVLKEAKCCAEACEPVEAGVVLVRKLHTVFHCLDSDGDGEITIKDYNKLAENFVKYGDVSTVTANQIKKKMIRLWNDLHGEEAKKGPITADVYASSILRRGRDMILICATYFHSMIFDCMDQKGDGEIGLEGFRIFHKAFGINEASTEAAFPVVDKDKDGTINFMEFLEAGINYFLTSDVDSPYNQLFGTLEYEMTAASNTYLL